MEEAEKPQEQKHNYLNIYVFFCVVLSPSLFFPFFFFFSSFFFSSSPLLCPSKGTHEYGQRLPRVSAATWKRHNKADEKHAVNSSSALSLIVFGLCGLATSCLSSTRFEI